MAVDRLSMQFYSSLHPRGPHVQGIQFYLGNPGLEPEDIILNRAKQHKQDKIGPEFPPRLCSGTRLWALVQKAPGQEAHCLLLGLVCRPSTFSAFHAGFSWPLSFGVSTSSCARHPRHGMRPGRHRLSCSTPRSPHLPHCLDERPRFLHGPLFPLSAEQAHLTVLAPEVLSFAVFSQVKMPEYVGASFGAKRPSGTL